MNEKRMQWINKPRAWSVTRRQLMNKCPRAFILKYGFKKKQGGFNRHLTNISNWASPYMLMQRALRGLVIQRLECFSKGMNWVENDLALKIRSRIVGGLRRQKSVLDVIEKRIGKSSSLRRKVSVKEIDRLIEICCLRYHSIISSPPFSDILSGKIEQWFTFSRLSSIIVRDFDLHISPDLVWIRGRNCHLLRFSVQGSSEMKEHKSLENTAMVIWAMNQKGLPSNHERYVIENVVWSSGRWNRWIETCNQTDIQDSMGIIMKDISQMSELYSRMGPACDLSQIPLAKDESVCRTCGHRDTCPGGENLQRASLIQSALEMAKAAQKHV